MSSSGCSGSRETFAKCSRVAVPTKPDEDIGLDPSSAWAAPISIARALTTQQSPATASMRVASLHIYPVKSLRGLAVDRVEIDALGFVGDRRFLIVDSDGRFLTQRTLPRMALIETALSPDALTLSARGAGTITVGRASQPDAVHRSVNVWSSEGLEAEDCGDEAAAWLEHQLGLRCRLVRAGRRFLRAMNKPGKTREGDVLAFNDGYPLLLISEASLDSLNDRLVSQGEEAVPMNRFRPNLVIAGAPAFAEDTWPRIQIGELVLRAGGPCGRCIMTTTDQATAERGAEPLRTLAKFRRDPNDSTQVLFGQNFIHETKSGGISVGEAVELITL
jgi:uncharacterized protein